MIKLTPHDKSFIVDRMMNHATPSEMLAHQIADEIRVEMARQKRTRSDLATVLSITAHTAGTRLNGRTHFNALELARVADWLSLSAAEIVRRAESAQKSAEATHVGVTA